MLVLGDVGRGAGWSTGGGNIWGKVEKSSAGECYASAGGSFKKICRLASRSIVPRESSVSLL